MDIQQFKEDIIQYSEKIGIDKIGFTTADPFTELKERLRRQQELEYQSGFEKGTIEERTEPKRLLPGAKSIISIALAYPSKIKNPPRSTRENRRGIFCRASWGQDYHHVYLLHHGLYYSLYRLMNHLLQAIIILVLYMRENNQKPL